MGQFGEKFWYRSYLSLLYKGGRGSKDAPRPELSTSQTQHRRMHACTHPSPPFPHETKKQTENEPPLHQRHRRQHLEPQKTQKNRRDVTKTERRKKSGHLTSLAPAADVHCSAPSGSRFFYGRGGERRGAFSATSPPPPGFRSFIFVCLSRQQATTTAASATKCESSIGSVAVPLPPSLH